MDPRRRRFLATSLRVLAGASLVRFGASPRVARAATLSDAARRLLPTSPYVYVSPLLADGRESRCHAELWFAWLDEAVVVIVAADRWKARALASGRDRARIWVGDHGRWRGFVGTNESFRSAPSFDARGAASRDASLLDRLLATYATKYPDEIDAWRDRMRSGFADGSRVLIRYTPA
ncbi:MAG: hypothetical protein R3E88_00400 [Myxococcota bacterium]